MKCERCPECGCPTFIMPDHLGEGYRICSKCKQEWWENIDYGKGTMPEPGQDEIMRQFEKCWHGVFDHLDKMLLIQITDVFRSGYKSGYTSRNAEIEAMKAKVESMKCCGNCKNCLIEDQYEGHYCFIDELLIEDIRVHKCSNWKAKI